ncbi:MAG: hypothetical protein L6R38_003281 [Xanthoria sp. 2 TBL-2021]|nr:MAG: hypothetical protein L6R38_003281 [Xanthoria sp. 2 TBL-2021]
MASYDGAKCLHVSIPETMEVVCHEAEEIDIWLHFFCVEVSKVPVVRGQSERDTVLSAVCSPHFLEEQNKIHDVRSLTTSLGSSWIFPIQVDALKATVHKPSSERRGTRIRKVEASDGNPGLKCGTVLQGGELGIQRDVIRVTWDNRPCLGIELANDQLANLRLRGSNARPSQTQSKDASDPSSQSGLVIFGCKLGCMYSKLDSSRLSGHSLCHCPCRTMEAGLVGTIQNRLDME